MGQFEFVASPVSAEDPCGPDLEGEQDYDTALAFIEGRLPTSFLKFSNPQKMSSPSEMSELTAGFDLSAELAPLLPLMKRSRDIRLLIPAAKLSMLAGDFARFAELVSGLAALVTNYWEQVHPRAQDDSFQIRESHLSLLADMPTIVMPVQEKPFLTTRRLGPISFRSWLLATKAITPRAKETVPDEAPLREALVKSDDFAEIKTVHQQLIAVNTGLQQIRTKFIEMAGGQYTPDFDKLTAVLGPFIAFLQEIIEEREPSAPPPGEAAEGEGGEAAEGEVTVDAEGKPVAAAPAAPKPAAISSNADAAAHLNAVEAYFRIREPSNPATLLVRQAQQLIGKSFIEAMQVLNPQLAEKAAIRIGGEIQLIVSAKQMAELAKGPSTAAAAAAAVPEITSRNQASSVMEAVEKFYKTSEPSSPVPLLLGRARTYSGKDFASLLKEIGPSA